MLVTAAAAAALPVAGAGRGLVSQQSYCRSPQWASWTPCQQGQHFRETCQKMFASAFANGAAAAAAAGYPAARATAMATMVAAVK